MVPLYLRQLSAPAHLPVTSAHVPEYRCRSSLPPVYSRAHFLRLTNPGAFSLAAPALCPWICSLTLPVLSISRIWFYTMQKFIFCQYPAQLSFRAAAAAPAAFLLHSVLHTVKRVGDGAYRMSRDTFLTSCEPKPLLRRRLDINLILR